MKIIQGVLIAVFTTMPQYPGLAQTPPASKNGIPASPEPGYIINLTQPAGTFHLNSPIEITMTLVNTTNGDILWSAIRGTDKYAWYSGYRYLLEKDGKEVETTVFHRKISGRQRQNDPIDVDGGSTILLPKPPGTMFVIRVDLKRLYQITIPGHYSLQVSRVVEGGKMVLHSNTVKFDVEP